MNRVKQIAQLGQSVWLDYIRRDLLTGGGLKKLIDEDGVSGLTSNPAIFEKAIAGSSLYDVELQALVLAGTTDAAALTEALAISDIRAAADLFRPVYQATQGADGFVSLEVSPHLAHDTPGTLADARRLWKAVARDNLMIKVPGTLAGAEAIRQLIAEGINVNVTLLFARTAYARVAQAYQQGLQARADAGADVSRVASVASFFVSRIDAMADAQISKQSLPLPPGELAIANAHLAYRDFQQMTASAEWQALAKKGARPQRLLWASTGTKNPAYRDTLYVETLLGPQTVNTLPPATLDAFRDHGVAARTVDRDVSKADALMEKLAPAGLNLETITDKLLTEGIQLFAQAYDQLLGAVRAKTAALKPA